MKYGLSIEEIEKLKEKGLLEKGEKQICFACYQEDKPIDKCYFGYISYMHLTHKHPELREEGSTPIKTYRELYHNVGRFRHTKSNFPKSKEAKEAETWETIKSEGIGNWSQRKLASTALKLEAIANEYIEMANVHKKNKESEGFMECMEKARQCMDTVGKLVKPTAPPRSKIDNEDKKETVSKADRKQLNSLMGLVEKIKKDSDVDTTKLEGAWHEPS